MRGGRWGRGRYHDGHTLVVDEVVVHGWLEEVGVLLEPGGVSCALLFCVILWYLCRIVHPNTIHGAPDGSRARSSLTTWAGSTGLGSLLL